MKLQKHRPDRTVLNRFDRRRIKRGLLPRYIRFVTVRTGNTTDTRVVIPGVPNPTAEQLFDAFSAFHGLPTGRD